MNWGWWFRGWYFLGLFHKSHYQHSVKAMMNRFNSIPTYSSLKRSWTISIIFVCTSWIVHFSSIEKSMRSTPINGWMVNPLVPNMLMISLHRVPVGFPCPCLIAIKHATIDLFIQMYEPMLSWIFHLSVPSSAREMSMLLLHFALPYHKMWKIMQEILGLLNPLNILSFWIKCQFWQFSPVGL